MGRRTYCRTIFSSIFNFRLISHSGTCTATCIRHPANCRAEISCRIRLIAIRRTLLSFCICLISVCRTTIALCYSSATYSRTVITGSTCLIATGKACFSTGTGLHAESRTPCTRRRCTIPDCSALCSRCTGMITNCSSALCCPSKNRVSLIIKCTNNRRIADSNALVTIHLGERTARKTVCSIYSSLRAYAGTL